MDRQDELARRTRGSSELSNGPTVSPLEQLLAKVQVRWPYPEMGDMEYCDWRETLSLYRHPEINRALNHLLQNPPKRELPDGSIQEYRGRPTLVDVTRTIEILREEDIQKAQAQRSAQEAKELAALVKRRTEHPEEFMGWTEFIARLKTENPELAAKAGFSMPTAPEPFDADFESKKREATELAEKFK